MLHYQQTSYSTLQFLSYQFYRPTLTAKEKKWTRVLIIDRLDLRNDIFSRYYRSIYCFSFSSLYAFLFGCTDVMLIPPKAVMKQLLCRILRHIFLITKYFPVSFVCVCFFFTFFLLSLFSFTWGQTIHSFPELLIWWELIILDTRIFLRIGVGWKCHSLSVTQDWTTSVSPITLLKGVGAELPWPVYRFSVSQFSCAKHGNVYVTKLEH